MGKNMGSSEGQNSSMYNLSDEDWLILLVSLVNDSMDREWGKYAKDLIYKNRFSSSNKVINAVEKTQIVILCI